MQVKYLLGLPPIAFAVPLPVSGLYSILTTRERKGELRLYLLLDAGGLLLCSCWWALGPLGFLLEDLRR